MSSTMLVITCDSECVPRVREMLAKHGVTGFTEVPDARGFGVTGAHLGTRAFPGAVTVVFATVADAKAKELVDDLGECARRLAPAEGFRVFGVPATEYV